jgi:hypothetical protein
VDNDKRGTLSTPRATISSELAWDLLKSRSMSFSSSAEDGDRQDYHGLYFVNGML